MSVKINDETIDENLISDMFYMTGWEDLPEIKIHEFEGKEERTRTKPLQGEYVAYVGDDQIMLCISKNRNVSVVINVDQLLDENGNKYNYNYALRTYHVSSLLNTLDLDTLNLYIRRFICDDYITVVWKYNNDLYEIHISIEL